MHTVKIKDLGKIVTGKTPSTKKPELFGDDYPFITPSDISSYDIYHVQNTERGLSEKGYLNQKSKLLPPKTVCYVCIGSTVGKICLTKKPSFTNQQLNNIIVDQSRYVPEYIYYRLRYETPRIQSISGGTGSGKAIYNKTAFEEHQLEIHDYPLQQKIAFVLSAYDDLIENNTQRIKILEEMAQLIYREWFVDFRFPGHKKAKFTDSELGKIPEGWEVSNLEYIAELVKDKFCESQHSNLPLLDLARIPRKSLAIIGFGQSDEIKTSRIVFKEGNILFGAIRPYFHKVIIAPYDGVTNVSVFVLKNKNVVGNYYLFNLLFSDEVVKWATQYSGGTKMPVINWQVLKTMKVIVPPRESLMDFESMANNIFSLIKALNLKTVVLRTIREILLPKLISGELDVSEVDIIIRDNEGEKGR